MPALTKPTTHASLHFLQRHELYRTEKPYSIQYFPHGDVPNNNVHQFVADKVPVFDMRPRLSDLDFDQDGFVVRELNSELSKEDFSVPDKVIDVYLEEVRKMLRGLLRTNNVAIVEYLVRRRHASFPVSTGEEFEYAQPVATAHIDFSPDCLVEMIHDRYADRAEELLSRRYRIVNVWKPLKGPLRDWPLVLCKPSSLNMDHDLELMDRVYPMNIEESIQIYHSEAQEWYFLSDQKENELLVFRGGDSNLGIQGGVPHCSFELKREEGQTWVPRESIEVRALVFDADEDLDLQTVAISRRHGPKATYQQQRQEGDHAVLDTEVLV